jgi:hypothetical protein
MLASLALFALRRKRNHHFRYWSSVTCSIQSTTLPSSRGIWGCPVPALLAGGEPNHIPRSDFLDCAAVALRPTAACGDCQRLAERMRMPCNPRTRLERNACALNQCRVGRLKQRVDTHCATKPFGGSLGGRSRRTPPPGSVSTRDGSLRRCALPRVPGAEHAITGQHHRRSRLHIRCVRGEPTGARDIGESQQIRNRIRQAEHAVSPAQCSQTRIAGRTSESELARQVRTTVIGGKERSNRKLAGLHPDERAAHLLHNPAVLVSHGVGCVTALTPR